MTALRFKTIPAGHSESKKWPGHYDCGNGKFRAPYLYRGKVISKYKVEATCDHCGAEHLQDAANARKSKRSFCTTECRSARVRSESVGNKVIKKRPHGRGHHVLVKVFDHPRMDRHGNVYEHILVMEKHIGRFIEPHERVHHINCVKDDNRPENLHLFQNDTEHFLSHGSLNACVEELLKRGNLIFNRQTGRYEVAS